MEEANYLVAYIMITINRSIKQDAISFEKIEFIVTLVTIFIELYLTGRSTILEQLRLCRIL